MSNTDSKSNSRYICIVLPAYRSRNTGRNLAKSIRTNSRLSSVLSPSTPAKGEVIIPGSAENTTLSPAETPEPVILKISIVTEINLMESPRLEIPCPARYRANARFFSYRNKMTPINLI